MPGPDPAAYRNCLNEALGSLQEAMALLTAAAMHARDADDREAAMAPVSGLELAAEHVRALVALATH